MDVKKKLWDYISLFHQQIWGQVEQAEVLTSTLSEICKTNLCAHSDYTESWVPKFHRVKCVWSLVLYKCKYSSFNEILYNILYSILSKYQCTMQSIQLPFVKECTTLCSLMLCYHENSHFNSCLLFELIIKQTGLFPLLFDSERLIRSSWPLHHGPLLFLL